MAGVVSKKVIEDIRFRCDIVDVIGSYFHLQGAGSSLKALCPFHKEKTPSFHVNRQRQSFHCFGCGAGGDVFRFIMQHEGVDFPTAIRMLAQRAGVTIESEPGEGGSGGVDKALLYRLHSEVAALYHSALLDRKSAAHARAYLEKRALPPEIVEAFQIGYAPNRWDAVCEWARRNKYRAEDVELCGLILRKPDAQGPEAHYYDRFRNRLMFPIHDEQGRVIGFSGRALEEDAKTAKYVNSPETPLFKKSRVLYALDKARRQIAETREALVCEGQIDVIRCHQAGFTTAVAAQGTAFTEEHIRILRRYADGVCLMFDSDRAGQDAAVRAAALFMDAGLAVRAATLPPGDDPDSFIRKRGADAFRQILDGATSAVRFQIDVLAAREDLRSEVGVMRAARAVLATIAHSPNAVQRAKLVQQAAERLNLPPSALTDDLRHLLRQQQRPAADAESAAPAPPAPRPIEEVALCEHLAQVIDHPSVAALVRKYLPLDMISDPICRVVAEAALQCDATGRDLHNVLRDRDDPGGEAQRFAAALMAAPSRVKGTDVAPDDAVKDLVLGLWSRKLTKERSDIERQAMSAADEGALRRGKEITTLLRHLKRWDDGAAVIEMELLH